MEPKDNQTKPLLLSDAPVGVEEEDFLWQGKDDITFAIEQIVCDTILNSNDFVAFAVHGSWGAGKTSFLKIVEHRLKKASENKDKIFFCWYVASAYQGTSVPVSLMLQILRTLGDINKGIGADAVFTRVSSAGLASLDYKANSSEEETEEKPNTTGTQPSQNPAGKRPKIVPEELHELATRLADLPDPGGIVESLINDGITNSGQSKLVLIIDDLDRCSLQFIGDLLGAMQRLSIVKNLFILLAVDQTRLQNALNERFKDVVLERGSRWASEKYFQYRIELPELDDSGIDAFIRKSLGYREQEEHISDSEIRADEKALEYIVESVHYFKFAIRHKVPRTIKACLNLVRPHLTREITSNPRLTLENARQVIKKRLISYLFQDFYDDWLEKAIGKPDSPEAEFIKEIEKRLYEESRNSDLQQSSGTRLSGEQLALFNFHLGRIKDTKLLQDQKIDLPVELIDLLALKPFFIFKPNDGREDWSFTDASATQRQLDELYEKSEQAEMRQESETSLTAAHEAYLLARNNFDASIQKGWLISNLALNAEAFHDYQLAEDIHHLAIKLNPITPNIRQNFAEFIVDKNRYSSFEEALAILNRLLNDSPDHKLGRTLRLLLKLKPQLGRSTAPERNYINKIKGEAKSPTQMADFLEFAVDIRDFNLATESFGNAVAQLKELNDMKAIHNFYVKAASKFYSPNYREYESIAMDLYRQVLTIDPEDLYSNYPFLLDKYDYKAEAGCLWFKCYQKSPTKISEFTMQGYVEYLKATGRPDLAEKAANSEVLDIQEPPIVETGNSLPKRFSEDLILPSLIDIFGVSGEPYSCYQTENFAEHDKKQEE